MTMAICKKAQTS